jgi:hypothetical protein
MKIRENIWIHFQVALSTKKPLGKHCRHRIGAEPIMYFDLANAPAAVPIGVFNANGNRTPRTPPAAITTEKDRRPIPSLQNSGEDR